MKRFLRFGASALCAALLSALPAGCGGDGEGGGGGGDFGDNDRNLVACLGDSITQGFHCEGAPYPARLAAYSGKTVKNYGVGGTTSAYGASVVGSALRRKPGYVCIFFGANDCIQGVPAAATVGNLRRIVQACKANKSRAILATPTPMRNGHEKYDGLAAALAAEIRALAKQEQVPCVDLYKSFGTGEGLLGADGLHTTDAGGDLIARKFNSQM